MEGLLQGVVDAPPRILARIRCGSKQDRSGWRVGVLIRHSPVPPASVYRDLDAVVISHAHLDHLDVPSLRLIDKETPVLAPAASLSWRSAPFISASVSSTRAREAGRRLFEAAETDLAETALC